MESFSVVDSMPMITVESEDATHLIATTSSNSIVASEHIVVKGVDDEEYEDKEQVNEGSEDPLDGKGMARIISDGSHIIANDTDEAHTSTRIITTTDATRIFTSESGHIMTSDAGQLISSDATIFSDSGSDIITTEASHIIMDSDGGGSILHSAGTVIERDEKAHIVSSDGEVIAVDGSLLDGSHSLHTHVTQVIEEAEEGEDSLLQRIKKEPGEVEEGYEDMSTLQIRVNASAPRKRDGDQSEGPEDSEKGMNDLIITERTNRYAKVDKDDPRSRLHFVKYMKRDGKTIKIWECGICGKEFMHQYTLMRHLPTHTDERNFRCNQCGKAFRQMSTLSQHKATHSKSRPYVCDLCQKTFSRVSTLISHKKTHTEEKQHQCYVCGKAFHQKGNLKNHMFTHTNERPYKCNICGRGFNQSSNLQCHKAKAHADGTLLYQYVADKYKCNYCEQAFSRRAQLRQHEEYKHGVRNLHGSRSLSGAGGRVMGNNSALLRKRKIGNVRIIQLPNGDRTFQEIGANDAMPRQRKMKPKQSMKNGILIEPIDTKAMHQALAAGRTPFALLKPSKGVPVLVKVQFAPGSKHMLVPAAASELRSASKFTVSSQQSGTKAVQIKVPVVATVIQRVDENGQVHMDVEAPADEEEEEEEEDRFGASDGDNTMAAGQEEAANSRPEAAPSIISTVDSDVSVSQRLVINPAVVQTSITEPVMEGEEEGEEAGEHSLDAPMTSTEDGIIISAMAGGDPMEYSLDQEAAMATGSAEETGEEISSVDLLATAVNLVSQAQMGKEGMNSMEGIQYLRQVNLREYEVVPANHAQATHIINQHGHIEQIKMVEESTPAVNMEQANISAFMDALQNVGYHLGTGNQQIIINADGNAMVVDQQVHMVIDGDMEGVVSDSVDPSSVNLVVHEVPEGIQATDGEDTT